MGFTISVRITDDRETRGGVTVSMDHVQVDTYEKLLPHIIRIGVRAVRDLPKKGPLK